MKKLVLAGVAVILTGCFQVKSNWSAKSSNFSTTHLAGVPHDPGTEWLFSYRVEGEKAILDSENVALVFPDLRASERRSFSFSAGSLPIQISGSGTREATVSCRRNLASSKLHTRYENGTNTIRFCGREVKLANDGRVAIVGDEVVDPGDGKKEVLVVSAGE